MGGKWSVAASDRWCGGLLLVPTYLLAGGVVQTKGVPKLVLRSRLREVDLIAEHQEGHTLKDIRRQQGLRKTAAGSGRHE